ncbi:unnamed protein product [Rhizophagus irregularis]|nr:unnamed protein product [Rhizophagus irregularis]
MIFVINVKIIEDLIEISTTLSSFTDLEFFTDGSYEPTHTQEGFPMGYGWTTSNLANVNITYNGSLKFFPSSTKAETMALLTALSTCPNLGRITIYTDSQATIDSFHKTKNLHCTSPRRYNKVNNNILWSSIHYIIKELSLRVHLIKVKAHSGNAFNDIADVQAKLGRTQAIPTVILHDHLSHQNITLNWNEEIPLDKDVQSTKDHLIDWALSSKWFGYNGRNDMTSSLHSKDIKWRIRCSTLTLPTLDILNRNFPLVIKDRMNCLLCDTVNESNIHLWECPQLYDKIRNCFIVMGDKLIDLLKIHADRLSLVIVDSIKYSKTFRWATVRNRYTQ